MTGLKSEHDLFTDAFAGKRVIITGGLGFIGSNLAHRLVEIGASILLVDSLIPQYGGNLNNISGIEDHVQVNISDVRDPYSLAALIKGQDYLFNLAGQTSHMDSMTDPYSDLEINCRAQLSILETCRQVNPNIRVVFASTRQLYGKPHYLPVNEAHPLAPTDVNGINKMAGEWYHLLYHNVYDIPTAVLRLTNTYGPRMRIKDARQTFLGIWIYSILSGRPFDVWDGAQLRDFTYVDDIVDALLRAALSPPAYGKVFNIGGAEPPISLKELAELLIETNGGGEFFIKQFPADRKRIDIGNYYADDTLIRDTLGWTPKVGLREGIGKTLEYFRTRLIQYE